MGSDNQHKIGILGSGKGSNFLAIQNSIRSGYLPASVEIVLSDVENAGILTIAQDHHIPHHFVNPGRFRSRLDESAEAECIRLLRESGVYWVVLAGFMRVLKGAFLEAFADRIVNIHPSLLPSFPGLHAWEQALDYRVKYTGVTVHLVDRGVDTGTILAQHPVPVMDDDTSLTLHQRIQQAEWQLYPRVLKNLVTGRYSVRGRNAVLKEDHFQA
ncbi:MAG: phosphoribosylglycinamide formyltransferase [Verrucomicrobia bacterium]|nr:phosphoribosylglycinamide formyltransferase [Verrucomicrobiota bacterium]